MIIKQLIKELEKYPEDAIVYAYEGEDIGIGITNANKENLGFISTREQKQSNSRHIKQVALHEILLEKKNSL